MVRRILGELQERFDLTLEIPDKADGLRALFDNALHMAPRGRIVLALDALNQLEDCDGALDLFWLPPVIPTNVRPIVSMLLGRPLDELRMRRWPTLTVAPLRVEERCQLIATYLKQYGKSLSPTVIERIAAASVLRSPHPSAPGLWNRATLSMARDVDRIGNTGDSAPLLDIHYALFQQPWPRRARMIASGSVGGIETSVSMPLSTLCFPIAPISPAKASARTGADSAR